MFAVLVGLALSGPTVCTAASSGAPADSLALAEAMARQGEDSVVALSIAVRQLEGASGVEESRALRVAATVLRLGGDSGSADLWADAALARARQFFEPGSAELAEYLLERALSLRVTRGSRVAGEVAGLLSEGEASLSGDRNPPRRELRADLVQAQAILERSRRNYPEAIRLYRRALELRSTDSNEPTISRVDNSVWLASILMLDGKPDEARSRFEQCLADLDSLGLGGASLAATIEQHLGIMEEAEGDVDRAIEHYRRAYRYSRRAVARLLPGFSRRRMDTNLVSALAVLLTQRGEDALAWRVYADGYRRVDNLDEILLRARASDRELVEAVRAQVGALAHTLGRLEHSVSRLHLSSAESVTGDWAVVVDHARTFARAARLERELRRRFGDDPRDASRVRRLQGSLRDDQAILGFVRHRRPRVPDASGNDIFTYAFALRSDGAPRWIPVDRARQRDLEALDAVGTRCLRILRKASEWPTRLPADPQVDVLLRELYARLFAPLEPALDGVEEILLYPSDLWPGLPYPALIDSQGRRLVDRFRWVHLLGPLAGQASSAARASSSTATLTLGDPTYSADSLSVANPTLEEATTSYAMSVLPRSVVSGVLEQGVAGLSRLPRLESSGWEARAIASMGGGGSLLTGSRATEQSLERACGGDRQHSYRWIHLATHALMHPRIPERSALALSPKDGEGLLYVQEIGFGWNLDCDLVTLSGCQTGGGVPSITKGPLGFVQALHAAGARNLLLSTTKVDDIATALLMERFYANVSDRQSPRVQAAVGAPMSYAAALAEAQRWLRDLEGEKGDHPFAHPVYWANFQLLGNGD